MSQRTSKIDEATREFLDDVARLMEANGINQAELARRLKASPAHVSKILSGRANLTVSTLLKISKALGAPMLLRLATGDEEATAGQDGGAGSGQEAEQVEIPEPPKRDLEATANDLLEKLPAEAVARIAEKFDKRERRKPGRPKGSGIIPDDSRLERMAALLVKKEARSERHAARQVAEEDPGHSKKSTIRRLRRKFAEDREQLLAAAQNRLGRTEAENEKVSKGADPRRADQPPVRARGASSPPTALREQTPAFLADLQRDFQIDRETVDLLRTPDVLEKIADLSSLRAEAALTTSPVVDADLFKNPADDLTRVPSPLDQVTRVEDSIADLVETSTPLDRATKITSNQLATTDLSSHVLTTKDLGYNLAASDDITGHKAMMRKLETYSDIDRKIKRLMFPFRED